MSSSSQRKAIKEFKNVTGASDKVAKACLSNNGWHAQSALNSFFNNPNAYSSSSRVKAGDTKKLAKLCAKYLGEGDDADIICEDKLEEFFTDAGVDLEGPMTMGLFFRLKCKTNGEIHKDEFINGFSALGVDTIKGIQADLQKFEGQLRQTSVFKEFYNWLFPFMKESEERKTIDAEDAINNWELLLPGRFRLLDKWLEFVKGKFEAEDLKVVSRDLWQMTLEFANDLDQQQVKDDLSNYEDSGAWPCFLDEFVEYVQEGK